VEEVPGAVFGVAIAFAAAVAVGEVEVLGCAPLEEQLAGLDVDLLECAVP
jgi:hypothetical protein